MPRTTPEEADSTQDSTAAGTPQAQSPLLLRHAAEGDLRITARGAEALLECMRTRGKFGYVKEDIFYAVLLHPAKVLDGPDGLQLVDSDGRRVEIESPSVLCGGKTLIVRGRAAGRELPDLVVTARDLARLACDNDGGS